MPRPATVVDLSAESLDPYFVLSRLAATTSSARELCRATMAALAEYRGAAFVAIRVDDLTAPIDECVVSGKGSVRDWKYFSELVVVESRTTEEAIGRVYEDERTSRKYSVMAAPLRGENGAMTLVLPFEGAEAMQRDLTELRSLATVTGVLLAHARRAEDQQEATPRNGSLQRAFGRAIESSSVVELAFAVAGGAKNEFLCQQAALGLVEGKRVRVLAVSGMEQIHAGSPGTRRLAQAMEECLDRNRIVVAQEIAPRPAQGGTKPDPSEDMPPDDVSPEDMPPEEVSPEEVSPEEVSPDCRLHRQWRAGMGDVNVASIPMRIGEECVAVLSLAREADSRFEADELEQAASQLSAYAPALVLTRRATRTLAAHARDRLADACRWLFARGGWARRVCAGLLLAIALWMFWGSWSYRVSVPFVISPKRVVHFAAPFEGTLAVAEVEQGQRVAAGQLLFEMDTTDLRLKQHELMAELEVARLESARHVDTDDLPAAATALARERVVRAHLSSVRQQIEQASVRAPENGVILSGEIQRRVGEVVPLGESLLEFAPSKSWCIDLEVPENDVSQLRAGMRGKFVTTARPDESCDFRIERIQPVAASKNGRSFFVATTSVNRNPEWMRAGMGGVATVEVGRRPVNWILFHRFTNFLHLHLSR